MKPASNTREHILDAAQELAQSHSLAGFSFMDIAKKVGIKKGSLYYHFESKDDMAVAMINRVREDVEQGIDQHCITPELTAPERLNRYFQGYADYTGVGRNMCTGGSFASIWSSTAPAVRQAVKRFGDLHVGKLTKMLEQGRDEGSVIDNGQSPQTMAVWIFATVQGASMIARMQGDAAIFYTAMEQLMDAIRVDGF